MKNVLAGLLLALTVSASAAAPVHAQDETSITDAQRVRVELGAKPGYQYLLTHADRKSSYWAAVTHDYIELYQDQLFGHSAAGEALAQAAEEAVQNWGAEAAAQPGDGGRADSVFLSSQVQPNNSRDSLAGN